MESGALKVLDLGLYRRGRFIGAVARWTSLGLGVLSLSFVWDSPGTRQGPAVAVVVLYTAFNAVSYAWQRGHGLSRRWRVLHDVVDAVAVGLGAAFSGALDSPMWLLLYPHVVATSVRGGVVHALSMGVLDAVIVSLLTVATPAQPLGMLHAVTLVFCSFMGGLTSSQLKAVQDRLTEANRELHANNETLSLTVKTLETTRLEQESALALVRESEARYRRLLERIQDGVLIIQEGRIAFANQAFGAMVGDSPEALIGSDFASLVPPEDKGEITGRYQRWEQSQAVSGNLESRLRTRQGGTLMVSIRAGSLEYQGRRGVIATIRDITRERRMEHDLKAHAERLAAINEIANAVNLSLTIEDIFSVVAEETRRLTRFDRLTIALVDDESGEVETVTVDRAVSRQRTAFRREEVPWAFRQPRAWCEGDPEPPPPAYRKLIDDDAVRAIAVVPLFSKDRVIGSMNLGRLTPSAFTPLDLAVMEPVARHVAIALDNARLIEAVRRRGHELESLLDVSRRVVERSEVQALLPLIARSVNRVMRTQHCILLLRSGEMLKVAAQEGLEPEVVEAYSTLRISDSLSGRVVEENHPVASLDMREEPRLMNSAMIERLGYRSFLGVPLRRGAETLGTLEVVTKWQTRRFGPEDQALMQAFADQAAVAIENARLFEDARTHLASVVEANRQLEELDRLRRQYLRNVSHEFRTPLTVIKGYAEFLMDSPPSEAGLRDVMKVIVESSDRVIDMVNTLIDVSRIEQEGAQSAANVQSLDLGEVTRKALAALRAAAEKRDIAFEVDLPEEELAIEGDGHLLAQAVRKLLENAVKYSEPGGRILVRGYRDGREVAFEVEDFGIGIAPEHVSRVFEKFYTVDGGITRRSGGTGVGLYLVREIVRLHHGTIEVRSRPGKGSLFIVRLPRSRVPAPQAAVV